MNKNMIGSVDVVAAPSPTMFENETVSGLYRIVVWAGYIRVMTLIAAIISMATFCLVSPFGDEFSQTEASSQVLGTLTSMTAHKTLLFGEAFSVSTGLMTISSNTRERGNLIQARADLRSDRHLALETMLSSVNQVLGLVGQLCPTIGNCPDSWEGSFLMAYNGGITLNQLRQAGALCGLYALQKNVLLFLRDHPIDSAIFSISFPQEITTATGLLGEHGLRYGTFLERVDGTDALIYVEGDSTFNRVEHLIGEHDLPFKILYGHGQFIGAGTSREDAAVEFRNIVHEAIAKAGTDSGRLQELLRRAEAGFHKSNEKTAVLV